MFLIIFFVGIWSASNIKLIFISTILFTAGLFMNMLAMSSFENDFKITERIIYCLNTLVFIYINFKLLFRNQEFNFNRVLGAVNVYFLIALLGAFLFELIHLLFGNSLIGDVNITGSNKDFADYIYFSFVSLTTLGIGDIVPANQAARMLSVFLSTIGILFPAVVIARLVSLNNKK
ncbi:MAG: ion channel [Chitinophagales bacterium]